VRVKRGTRPTTHEAVSERIQLHIPKGRLQKFSTTKRYGDYTTVKARHRGELLNLSAAEILLAYNAELRGLANYYARAKNAKRDLNKLAYLWWCSLFKTLAMKHRQSVRQVARRLRSDGGYTLVIKEEERPRAIHVFRLKDLQPPAAFDNHIDIQANPLALTLSRAELIRRLNASECEYCGTVNGPFEVHHIRKLKDVAKGKDLWQQMMAARRRKTLILCQDCHRLLHAARLPGYRQFRHAKAESRIP